MFDVFVAYFAHRVVFVVSFARFVVFVVFVQTNKNLKPTRTCKNL